MKILLAITLLLFQLSYSAAETVTLPEPGVCGVQASDRIHGGRITATTAHPWAVNLVFRFVGSEEDLFHCGGTLISNQHVLTAAHCIDGVERSTKKLNHIRLGEWDLLSDNDCDDLDICNDPPLDVGIESMVMHEGFHMETLYNDIALIKLNRTVTFTDFVSPCCLPVADAVRNLDTNQMTFTAVGWGRTEHRNGTYAIGSRYKLAVQLPGVNRTYCDEALYDDRVEDTQLCAGAKKGEDSCQGDSGGGLIAAVEGYHYVFGVVSYGYNCADDGMPGVYTRVTSFLDWIKQHMK